MIVPLTACGRLVFFTSLSLPLCYAINLAHGSISPLLVFLLGVFFLGVVPATAWKALPASAPWHAYVLSAFAFFSLMDLLICLTALGYTHAARFYLDDGEPYLATSHGIAIALWDGTVQYGLQVFLAVALATPSLAREPHVRTAGMVWCGSILMSVCVFLPGNLIGSYATRATFSYFLNVPFVVYPAVFLVHLFRTSWPAPRRPRVIRPALVIDYFVALIAVLVQVNVVWRGLVALNSPLASLWPQDAYLTHLEGYGRMFALVSLFYILPFLGVETVILFRGIHYAKPGGYEWLGALHIGAAAQSVFAYGVAVLREGSNVSDELWVFLAASLLVPFWFWVRSRGVVLLDGSHNNKNK